MASFVVANWANSSMKKIMFEDLILLENSDFMVINKPPYLSSLDDRHEAQNILDLAKTGSGGHPRLSVPAGGSQLGC